MREKINVLYYPDFWVAVPSLVKAILLFDELHFMDRPSMMFGKGQGQFGTIGSASPLRQFEDSFREAGVPFFVHPAPMGPVSGEWYEDIKADVNDTEFLKRFQNGLKSSAVFRRVQVPPGNYGEYGDQDGVAQRLTSVDLSEGLRDHESAIALFQDPNIRHFSPSTPAGCAKHLVADAVVCSAKMNLALKGGTQRGFLPFADSSPYGDLLGAKYARAINRLEPAKNKIQITDLSFAIFDELIPAETANKIKVEDAVRYRKASESAREEFLEHLGEIQTKQGSIGVEGDYRGEIEKLVNTEIRPAVGTFRKRLLAIDDAMFGSLAKGAIGALGGSSALQIFGDLSWQRIIGLAGGVGAYMAKAAIDAFLAKRAAKRECSISYVLSLDE
jgi:hypothetical protein